MTPTNTPARRGRTRAALGCAAALLLVGGCAAVQPPAVAPVADIDVADVQRAPPATSDAPATVRWGGTVARVANTDAGTTELEIVARPLGRGGRPRHVDASAGRFLAEVDRFLDPEIVREGRDVTVTGTVAGLREGEIGRTDYRFPVVEVENLRFWKAPDPRDAAWGPYGPYGYAPYGAPYGAYGPYGPVPYGHAYDPFGFDARFWHGFWHDPIHRPIRRPGPRGGRVGVGVTVRP